MKTQTLPVRNHGFALIVTLSLMILLTVIAVGLLSLSSITLRAAGQGEAMATAKANARLALMLALGDLQKTLGPDRAVTATSEILGSATAAPTKPNLTGAWESWLDFKPAATTPPNYVGQKSALFQRWLVSSANPAAIESRDFASAPWTGNTVELVGAGSLGTDAAISAKVTAGLVPVARGGKVQGSYAWHVADESVKARANSYRDLLDDPSKVPPKISTLAKKRSLLAGHRPDLSVMKNAEGVRLDFLPTDNSSRKGEEVKTANQNFELSQELTGKLTDIKQFDLLPDALVRPTDKSTSKIKQFRNDVTPYSLGVMVDVRNGGLKQDLSSIFEMSNGSSINLPPEFSGIATKKLYQSVLGSEYTGPDFADPYWSNLAGYYNSFRNISSEGGINSLEVTAPATISSQTASKVSDTYFPGPVIAKVDTIFSLVTHPMSEIGWWNNTGAPDNYDCFMSLIYTPVVTLHNPYNVSIKFYKMGLTFVNVPVAFNFMFQAGGAGSFVSQSVTPGAFESINDMTTNKTNRGEKTFRMTIANWVNDDPLTPTSEFSEPIIMKPGETLICGPAMRSTASFATGEAFDWDKSAKLTESIKAKPKYTPGLGFEVNGVTIANLGETTDNIPGGSGPGWCSFLLLRDATESPNVNKGTDQFYIEFQAQRPSWHPNYESPTSTTVEHKKTVESAAASFSVTATLQTSPTGSATNFARLDFTYGNNDNLKNFFGNRVYRYPPTGSYNARKLFSRNGTPYASQGLDQHPFAIFSANARTTNGGVYETGSRAPDPDNEPSLNLLRDGRVAGKPFLFHNPSKANMVFNLATQRAGAQAYELNLQPFISKTDFSDSTSIDGTRVPALSANTTSRGIKSGSYLELPTGPMQTIADFRRSNVLTSAYLPHFAQPIGNSLLHPLMSPEKIVEINTTVSPNSMLDQSVLANLALYDRFYFSTFASRGQETPDAVFDSFMEGLVPLPSQAFQPFLPLGATKASSKTELFSGNRPTNTAYQKAAEYQMIRGPFNVNSTSVQAWMAVLASMKKADIATLWAKNATLDVRASSNIPILGMSLLNGGVVGGSVNAAEIDNEKTNDWNGHREISENELNVLATKIVEQIRLRGPFLSMSEFVNRQIGPLSPLSLSGALEQAIADSGINSSFLFDHVTPLTLSSFDDPSPPALPLYGYKTKAATIGNPAAGAPGWVSQGDLLRILEPAATVRSDTFVIRVCGQAQDASGSVTARAYAEAVVQRTPEYLDPVDRPSLNASGRPGFAAVTKSVNLTFGRRMNLLSFRWLSNNEI
jgi:hypothetical protein